MALLIINYRCIYTCQNKKKNVFNALCLFAQIMDIGTKLLGQRAFNQFMKMTFYGQFVAGEDHMAIRPLIQKNQAFGVGSVLDYSVEEDISQEEAEQKEMEYASCGITKHFSRHHIPNICRNHCVQT